MKAALGILFAAAALAGCVTDMTEVNPKTVAAISQNQLSAIVFSMRDDLGCTSEIISMSPRGQAAYSPQLDTPISTMPPGGTNVSVVLPGKYRLAEAKCELPYHIYYGRRWMTSRSLSVWFSSVDVKPGEVVYIGTLEMESVEVERQVSAVETVVNLLTIKGLGPDRYPVFSLKDETEATRARLRAQHPELADRMVTRLPDQILLREAFVEAFNNAYKPNPDGSLPTLEQAQARLDKEVDIAIEKSIAERIRKLPKPAPQRREPPKPERPVPVSVQTPIAFTSSGIQLSE